MHAGRPIWRLLADRTYLFLVVFFTFTTYCLPILIGGDTGHASDTLFGYLFQRRILLGQRREYLLPTTVNYVDRHFCLLQCAAAAPRRLRKNAS
jgi:hypothetical protein